MARFLLFVLLAAFQGWRASAFSTSFGVSRPPSQLFSSNNPEDKPTSTNLLGFDAPTPTDRTEPPKVRVDLVDDVDSFSLTAIGFGLIAFNFLVLANLGDGGIAGFVATIINTFRD